MSKTTRKQYSLHIGMNNSRCKLSRVVASDENNNTVTEFFDNDDVMVARNINYDKFWIGA